MKITIKTFAALKEAIGDEIVLNRTEPVSIQELKECLSQTNSKAADLISRCRISIDLHFVNSDFIIENDIVVYFIPPSSGG